MKTKAKKILSLIIPLFIGIAIIYYQYTTLSQAQLDNIKNSLFKANYFYVLISLGIAVVGFWSRAYRWKFALKQMGYYPKFHNNFMTVCVSYLVNLTVPRSGEISRAALLKKYENVPFDKGFGTIIAERIVDMLLFLTFVVIAFLLQFDKLAAFLQEKIPFQKLILTLVIGLLLFVLFIIIWLFAEWKIVIKLKQKLSGLQEGMSSIFKMQDKWAYLFHSLLIWLCYLAMFYIVIFALPETENLSFTIVLMGFIFGTLAVGFTNGGLGAYPVAITMIFALYGVSNDVSIAFGWLIWTSQTILTIILGLISYLLFPILNKK